MNDNSTDPTPSKARMVLQELVKTEYTFLTKLLSLSNALISDSSITYGHKQLLHDLIQSHVEYVRQGLFANILGISEPLSEVSLNMLESQIPQLDTPQALAMLIKLQDFMGQPRLTESLVKLATASNDFQVHMNSTGNADDKGYSAITITPAQRAARYPLLLAELHKQLKSDHVEQTELIKTMQSLVAIANANAAKITKSVNHAFVVEATTLFVPVTLRRIIKAHLDAGSGKLDPKHIALLDATKIATIKRQAEIRKSRLKILQKKLGVDFKIAIFQIDQAIADLDAIAKLRANEIKAATQSNQSLGSNLRLLQARKTFQTMIEKTQHTAKELFFKSRNVRELQEKFHDYDRDRAASSVSLADLENDDDDTAGAEPNKITASNLHKTTAEINLVQSLLQEKQQDLQATLEKVANMLGVDEKNGKVLQQIEPEFDKKVEALYREIAVAATDLQQRFNRGNTAATLRGDARSTLFEELDKKLGEFNERLTNLLTAKAIKGHHSGPQ